MRLDKGRLTLYRSNVESASVCNLFILFVHSIRSFYDILLPEKYPNVNVSFVLALKSPKNVDTGFPSFIFGLCVIQVAIFQHHKFSLRWLPKTYQTVHQFNYNQFNWVENTQKCYLIGFIDDFIWANFRLSRELWVVTRVLIVIMHTTSLKNCYKNYKPNQIVLRT